MDREKDILPLLRCIFASFDSEKSISEFCPDNVSSLDWDAIYSFFSNHAIVALASDLLPYIPEKSISLRQKWKESIYTNVYSYTRLISTQKQVLDALTRSKVKVVVLKGTSASKYYPKPQYRTMGDIDLLVKRDQYLQAVRCLNAIGCIEITNQAEAERGRHRSFQYKNVVIELHSHFSLRGNIKQNAFLDTLLFDAMPNDNTVLPDEENGLVLLSHIRQHLEEGMGLRQIIDWMMFVRSYLNDERWRNSFQKKSQNAGLEELAIITTRMCQIYLGLPTENITWCKDADEALCDELMQYVMDCGNFGGSREMLQSSVVEKLPPISHPIQFILFLQSRGEKGWKALNKHPYLKPFAWIYQSCRYIKLAFQNKVTPNKLKSIYDEGNKRNEMFAALGLK